MVVKSVDGTETVAKVSIRHQGHGGRVWVMRAWAGGVNAVQEVQEQCGREGKWKGSWSDVDGRGRVHKRRRT
jgi:hypothetical protein